MANGTIALQRTGSGYLTGQIIWSSVSNGTQANTSKVTAELQIQRSALNATTGTFSGTLTIGSVSESIHWYGTLPSNTWVTVKTMTATVSHNADGSGSCYLYAIVNGPSGTTMEGTHVSGSSTVALDGIPRYATLVSVSDFTDEGNPEITYSNPAGEAVNTLQACISLDGVTPNIAYKDMPKTGTRYTFPLTEDERNVLRAATPNSNTMSVFVFLRTVIGGEAKAVHTKATLKITNAHPKISPVVVDTNSFTIGLTGDRSILVPLHSTARVTINGAAQKYATIVSQKVEHGAAVLTGDGTFSPVTNNRIKFSVTDSRGNTTTQYAANTILPYFNPTCSIGNNTPEIDGSFAFVVTGLFYNGYFGTTLTVQYRYKKAGGSYPNTWTTIGRSISGNQYTATANLTGLDYQTTYIFQARVIDPANPNGVYSAEKAIIAKPVFDWGQNDFRFNIPVCMPTDLYAHYFEYSEDSVLDTYLKDLVSGMPNLSTKRILLASTSLTNTLPSDNWDLEMIKATSSAVAHFKTAGYSVHRYFNGTTWGAYIWDNPPMVTGVEYCTTEKFNGKSVYAKRVNAGTLPNSSYKDIAIGTTISALVRMGLKFTSSSGTIYNYQTESLMVGIISKSIIRIYSLSKDSSGYTGEVIIHYTKD